MNRIDENSNDLADRPRSTRRALVRVLLVESSPARAESLRALLSEALYTDHRVTWVLQIAEALSLLDRSSFDVVLLDLERGESVGLEALQRIRGPAASRNVPIVVLDGRPDESLALEATRCGAQDYVHTTGLQARVLIRTVRQAIERHDLLAQLERAQEREIYLSSHDRLTGLPNRMRFTDRLVHELHTARRHRRWVGVLALDLDRFSVLNDTLGHDMADEVLQIASRRLRGCLRSTDTLARTSADQFAILLPDLTRAIDAAKVASNLGQSLKLPLRLGGRELYVTCSIGIAVCPEDGTEPQVLINAAEAALAHVKRAGGCGHRFYTAEMNASSARALTLESDLRRAIESASPELTVHLQPIVDGTTGGVLGAESLARWKHPELGQVSPQEFIPVAETRGLIVPIGVWVLRHACEQIRVWQEAGLTPVPIAVNVSPRQFWNTDFVGMLQQTLAETGVDGSLLRLELTESSVMHEPGRVAEALEVAQQLAVRISIDDFGTGFSSLSVLQQLPVNALKIDRTFMKNCSPGARNSAVVTAIIGLAENLGMQVIAEGVETEEQRRFLLDHGCTMMQGFLFHRPMPADRFTRLIACEAAGQRSR